MLMLRDANGESGSIRIVDPVTGRALLPPFHDQLGHDYLPSPFTPNGQGVLIRDSPQSVRLMDTHNGRPLGPSMRQQDPVEQWAFSPNGRYLFVMMKNGDVQVRNLPNGTVASGVIHGNRVDNTERIQFSPDGQYAVTLCETCNYFWPLTGEFTLHPQILRLAENRSFIFSPNGKTFIARGWKKWLWNTRSLTPIPLSIDYAAPAITAIFSPDSARVLTVLADGTANVWDARSGRPVTAPLHQNGVISAAFCPDGTMAATTGGDGMCRIWDANTGEALTPLFPAPNSLSSNASVEFAANHLVAVSNAQMDVWNIPTTSEPLERLMARAQLLSGSRIDPDIGPIPVAPATLSADWALVGPAR